MKVLYISISFPREEEGNNLYTDLAKQIAKENDITVVVTEETNKIKKTTLGKERNIDVLRIKTGNIFNVNLIEKAISYIMMQYKVKRGINKFLKSKEFDLIVFTSPPITLSKVIKYAMKKFGAKSYLMQKDIFPQNAVDIGLIKKNGIVYKYFRKKEKEIYKIASKIGCMSEGNIEYILKNNTFIEKEKIELFPNTIKINEKLIKNQKYDEKYISFRKKHAISKDSVLALYGGNFGKPQGIDFIMEVLNLYKNSNKVTFVFLGKGTEKNKLYEYIKNNEIKNVITLDFIPKEEYNKVLEETDIGLIFLDYRFTIPNIPSRTLAYFEYKIPVFAATDRNTDYKNILEETNSGIWVESNNIKEYKNKFDKLLENKEERIKLGLNGRKYLEESLTVEKSVEILQKVIKK